jgi:hypothetical protein
VIFGGFEVILIGKVVFLSRKMGVFDSVLIRKWVFLR